MARFIKLTRYCTGHMAYINIDRIEAVAKDERYTVIHTGSGGSYNVENSVDDVMLKIGAATNDR